MGTALGVRVAMYRRISDDAEGLELGVTRQLEDLRAYVLSRGYELYRDYCDNDLSASAKARKERPEFKRLLGDARAGKFHVILAYTSARLTRVIRENEDLIELAEKHGIRYEYLRSPSFDLNTADGRFVARTLANNDAAESERASERKTRQRRQEAEQGRARGGQRPFGWQTPIGPLEQAEARLLKGAAEDVLKGDYLARIVARWSEAGVRTVQGKEWSRTALRSCLTSPRIAGLAVYRRELLVDAAGEPVKGSWPAILDVGTWLAVCARLEANGANRQPSRTYLLSGVVRCTGCGTAMQGAVRENGHHDYKCADGCGKRAISGRSLDALIEKLVLRKLGDRKAELPAPEWAGEEELARAETQRAELLAAYKAGTMPGSVAFPEISDREETIARLKRERAAATRTQLPPSGALAMWESGDILQRREVIKRLWSAILIHPAVEAGQRRFDPARVEPVERES